MEVAAHPRNNSSMSFTLVAVEELIAVETIVTTERRQKERHQVGRAAKITIFGMDDPIFYGTLTNVAEGGVQLMLGRRVAPSSLVKIEYGDDFLLGEVIYSNQDNGEWLTGVKVEHGLFGLGVGVSTTAASDVELAHVAHAHSTGIVPVVYSRLAGFGFGSR